MEELSCKELVELVTEYLEGALPEPRRSRFEAHLAACTACRVYLEQIQRTRSYLGRLPPVEIPEALKEKFLDAFRNWKKGS